MTDRPITGNSSHAEVITALSELIEALDHRLPQAGRSGEIRIVRDAALLRDEAVARIDVLRRAGLNHPSRDQALVDAIMTDDGNPTPGGEERRTGAT